jgi:NAD(P)-dependent dehydrogenase (short-subunit alcohol dehydrogenase family)
MFKTHEGRVAVVTGAAKGIGNAIAHDLTARGATVVLVDRDDCQAAAKQIGGASVGFTADVANEDDWARIADAVKSQFGRADIVVNNAGIYPLCDFEAMTTEIWRSVMSINLDAHFYSAKAFVPIMRENGFGRFVNFSSNSIGYTVGGFSAYIASKMGVIGFVRGLANDVSQYGITVNAIIPTFTATPGTTGAPEELIGGIVNAQAIKRVGTPEDLLGPIAFLTSDEAAFVTGQAISADGGLLKTA